LLELQIAKVAPVEKEQVECVEARITKAVEELIKLPAALLGQTDNFSP